MGLSQRSALRRAAPLLGGLGIQAATTYLTLVLAGRLLGAARFGAISAMYVLVTVAAAGLFLPLEQEIARRRGQQRELGVGDATLARRAAAVSLSATSLLTVAALVAHSFVLRILDGDWSLFAAFCVALPGYALCFIFRGVFAGSGELHRYGVQLGVEGCFRLAGVVGLVVAGRHSVAGVGWLFGAAPWVALAVSLVRWRPAHHHTGMRIPLIRPLGVLLVSSFAAQLLINAGPLVIQLLSTPAQRDSAGAFLAALVVVRVPVFLFTAVQPSFLPAMAAHAAGDRQEQFTALLRRVLAVCGALTVSTTVVMTALGPWTLRLLFGFHNGVGSLVFLAMGVSVSLFLVAAILAQALLGRARLAATTVGWLIGLAGLAAGTAVSGSAVTRATVGFLAGALAAAATFAVLMVNELRHWRAPTSLRPPMIDPV